MSNKFKTIINNIPLGFAYHRILKDNKGNAYDYIFEEVNQAFCKMTGFDQNIIGKKVTEFIPEIKQSKFDWIKVYGDVEKECNSITFNQYFEPLGKWFEISAFSFEKNYFGTITREITKDIQERHHLTNTIKSLLVRDENFEEGFFSISVDLLCIANLDGDFIKLNKEWENVLGYSIEYLEGKKFTDFIHPEDLDKTYKTIQELSKQKDVVNFTNRYKSADGSYKYIEWRSHPKDNLIYAVARDVTKRVLSEKALAESERSKSTLLSNLPGMAYRCKNDENWTMEFVSDRCYELTGYNSTSLIDNKEISFADLILPEYKKMLSDEWESVLFKKEKLNKEYRIKTAAGDIKWVLELGQGVYDQNGNVIALEGFILDITKRKIYEIMLNEINDRNDITGIFNKRKLIDDIIKRNKNEKQAALIINFRNINIITLTYGLTYTDTLIKNLSTLLKRYTNEKTQLYHILSDKFLFYIKNYRDEKQLSELSKSIIATVKNIAAIQTTGCIIGICKLEKESNPDEIIQNALAITEEIGKDNVFGYNFFDSKIMHKIKRSAAIKDLLIEIAYGRNKDDFYLEYQPIYSCNTKKIYGVEILSRIKSEKFGQITPDEFIPLAEETQLILPFGKRVIEMTCETMNEFIDKGINDLKYFVNISAIQLIQDNFIFQLIEIFNKTGINPANFGIEITESIFFDQYDLINKKFAEIKELGVMISIDDFGSGYSSLIREGELNIDIIKIDKYFSDKIMQYDLNKVITADIISMAHKLGHKVIAEGVENKKQLDYLKKNRCDMVQGHFLSKSLKKNEILKLLV